MQHGSEAGNVVHAGRLICMAPTSHRRIIPQDGKQKAEGTRGWLGVGRRAGEQQLAWQRELVTGYFARVEAKATISALG